MSSKAEIISKIHERLSSLLEFTVPPDLIDYVCSIQNDKDFEEYFSSLLDFSNPKHVQFVKEVRALLKGGAIPQSQLTEPQPAAPAFVPPVAHQKIRAESGYKKEKFKSSQKFDNPEEKKETTQVYQDRNKKKPKFVNLYSQEGKAKDIVLLKGRHKCNCEASKHPLINNCSKCGRIVCEQEGVGPCLFCGSLVCTPQQQSGLKSGSKRSEKLREHLMKQTITKDQEIALQKRDKLLEYDKTSERMTKVIDDESDYYTTSSVWLSAEEQVRMRQREAELQAHMHSSRRDKKFTLDFTGRCVLEEQPQLPIDPLDDPVLKRINQNVKNYGSKNNFKESIANPYFPEVKFMEVEHKQIPWDDTFDISHSRIQDRELMEMSDQGMCLSMHQPWASLLVTGIKTHEGRSWYTLHRGLLWIAAAAKVPTPTEIQEEENSHRELLGNPSSIKFPTSYPVGCLLGCVNVVDCLSQDDYRQLYPAGPSLEPYVFICENPRMLPINFPMKGKHKIYKLERKIHQAAQNSLKRLAKLHADQSARD